MGVVAFTAALDKTTYAPGEPMTLTVTSQDRIRAVSVTVVVEGMGSKTLTGDLLAAVTVTDPDRPWVASSDDGHTAVYTSTA